MIRRTGYRVDSAAQNLGARVVRIDVLDRSARDERILSIDFLIHDFNETTGVTQ
jgi:hypothetical protein